MGTDQSDSPERIERDANTRRREVEDTLDELRDRFSFKSLTHHAADYLRGDGGRRLAVAARENPLAFIVAAASIGWLLSSARREAHGPELALKASGLRKSGDRKPDQDAEDDLENALEQTFPASDPVSAGQILTPGKPAYQREPKEDAMNWDTIKGQWKQIKGKAKEQWGDLTDDDLDRVEGNRDQLAGRIQERYGLAKDDAERQVDEWYQRNFADNRNSPSPRI